MKILLKKLTTGPLFHKYGVVERFQSIVFSNHLAGFPKVIYTYEVHYEHCVSFLCRLKCLIEKKYYGLPDILVLTSLKVSRHSSTSF